MKSYSMTHCVNTLVFQSIFQPFKGLGLRDRFRSSGFSVYLVGIKRRAKLLDDPSVSYTHLDVYKRQLMERPAPSLTQALSGRMPGVQVNTNSGRPGGRTTILVRGFSSTTSSNYPRDVVDGVMLPQGNQNQFSSAIDYINPNDIVSVEVLKDASSTAIYGARGANGVILVTTKKGKAGEGTVTYNLSLIHI